MIRKIAAIVPGPAVFFIGKWLELFSRTHLTYPDWQNDADNIVLAIGSVIAIVLCLLLKATAPSRLFVFAWISFFLFLISIFGCWGIWFHLGTPMPSPSDVERWQDIWELVYIVAMLLLITTLTLAGLYQGAAHPSFFWIAFVVIVSIVVVICAYLIWWR